MRCAKDTPLYRPWEAPNHGCVSFGFIERAKTMIKTGLTSLRCLVLLACIWAQADTVTAQQPRVPMPAKNSPQYWVLRSEAVRELTRFMTKKRTELKRKYNHFPRYLDQIGKRKDYGSRNIKVPDDPRYRLEVLGLLDEFERKNIQLPEKPLSWDQLVDIAMQYLWTEGYMAVDVEGGEELQRYQEILQSRERFGRKVRADIKVVVDRCVQGWCYLGTIKQQEGFRLYLMEREAKRKEDYLKKRAEWSAQVKEQMRKDEQAMLAREKLRQEAQAAQERELMRQYQQQVRSAQVREMMEEYDDDLRRDGLRYRFGYGY